MKHRTKKRLIASSFLLSLALVYMGTTHTLGWFDNRINSPVELVVGQSTSAYFYDGKGTKDDPYIITNKRHLYNLAWLQYIGHFNQANDSGVITPVYFKVATTDANSGATTTDTKYTTPADIDCGGLVLPPIGTSQYPFVGVFDGNNSVIRNYTVTDSLSTMTNPPNEIKNNQNYVENGTLKHCSIIGTFGVVGLLDDKVKAVDSSNSSTTFTISGDVKTNVSNFYVDQVTIKPTASNTLAGLIVGYANANVSYCGAYRSKIDFSSGTSKLDAKVSGTDVFSNVSSYTLIGDYNPNAVSWSDRPGQGTQQDWGGSIDFESLNQRLTYIMANSTKSSYNYKSTAFNTNIYYTSSTAFNVTSTSLQTAILNSGTYLPLNVDSSKITEDNYKNASSESVLSTNTGYIVGEGSGSNGYLRSMHNKTNKDNSVVNCSFYTLNSEANSPSRADSLASSNISFLWLTNEGKTYRIRDDDNKDNVSKYTIPSKYTSSYTSGSYEGIMNSSTSDTSYAGLNLVKYNDVKSNFISSLTAATTETFYGTKCYLALNYLQLKTKTEPKSTTYSNVTLNGTTGSYDLFSGGINYTLKKDGYMSMLCGMSYQGECEKGNLPDIYYVDSSGGTKTLKKIYKIIKKNGKTAFKFDDTSLSSDETLVFDLNKMSTGTLMEVGGIYYFEFPMIAGDYFMTRYDSTTKVYVPYIYYLDIGANAGDSTEETKDFTISKIDFVYSKNQTETKPTIYLMTNEDYTTSGVLFKISGTSTSQIFYFYRLIEDSAKTVYYYKTTTDGLTITPTGSPVSNEKANWSTSSN